MASPLTVLRGSRLAVGSKTRSGQSIAVADGQIVALGADDDLTEHGRAVRTADLDGRVVLPGLVDTHPHLLHFAAMAAAAST